MSASSGWAEAFLEMMAVERAAAKNTITAYGKDLTDASGFLAGRGRDLGTLPRGHRSLFRGARRAGPVAGDGLTTPRGCPPVLSLRPGEGWRTDDPPPRGRPQARATPAQGAEP
uniref:Site-specific integrase n=1 Tax=Phenylobacterium glaciei TaxID=2803784 RepID=A0A974SAZ1_9CAUL|nr:site-specific integrase [Phenylobacterium glaciei]